MCMVSLYLLAILCCHTIDWDIFLRYWCLSQIYYYIIIIITSDRDQRTHHILLLQPRMYHECQNV